MIRISGMEHGAWSGKGERGSGGEGEKGGTFESQGSEVGGQIVEFDVHCHTPGVEKEPVVVTVSLDGRVADDIVFDSRGDKKLWYYLGHESGVSSQGSGVGGNHEILFEVSRTWNPKRMMMSVDERDLGVAVSEPVFVKELPQEGVGFYHWEKLDEGNAGWIRKEMTEVGGQRSDVEGQGTGELRFRWTGRMGALPIDGLKNSGIEELKDGQVVFLRCGHPDIGNEPVVVKIRGDSDLLRQVEFGNHDWRKVVFEGKELDGVEVMTFEVSRTWNPKRMGVSEDGRDLGVALIF